MMGLAAAPCVTAPPEDVWSIEANEGLGDAGDEIAVDELFLSPRGLPQCGGGEPVDLGQRSLREFVQGGERVVGEDGAVGACGGKSVTDVAHETGIDRLRVVTFDQWAVEVLAVAR